MPRRLLIANLDCEQDFAYARAPRRLPRMVRARISAAGTLMAALGQPGDALWTPEPVAAERTLLARARGLELLAGALPPVGDFAEILAWGETFAVAKLRSASAHRDPDGQDARTDELPKGRTSDWPASLWRLRPAPEVARQCNDRRYAFALNHRLSRLLPGAAILDSVAELEAHLRAGGHQHGRLPGSDADGPASDQRTWVLEAPFSASGRFRLRRRGAVLSDAARTRARRLFDTFGQLIFQPWVERVVDVGCAGLVTGAATWTNIGQHVLTSDAAGVFRGIVVSRAPGSTPADSLPPDLRAIGARALGECRAIVPEIARQLATDGYRGPFGIDGFAYRAPDGTVRIYPLCEINARLTFGALVHHLAKERDLHRCRLTLEPGPDTDSQTPESEVPGVPLLAPNGTDRIGAWLHEH